MTYRRRLGIFGVGTALAALALSASACTSDPSGPDYGRECASFAPDPATPFFPASETFVDPDPMVWPRIDPAEVELDPAVLEEAAEAMALSPVAASLLVVRHGQLAFERYFNGFTAADANNVHSLSKSILSVLTGIAIDDDAIDLDTRLGDVLPADVVGEHGDVTVENLVTMSSGVEVPDPEWAYEWEPGDGQSLVRAVLERPRVAEPGSEFVYSSGMTHVLAATLDEATGLTLCEFAAQRLLGPLGIDVERWHVDLDGYFGGPSFLTPRELARFGQLVADGGRFDGEQLVSASWLDESLSPRWGLDCRLRPPVPERYGYLWWIYEIGGHEVWVASGQGAQDLAIIEDLDLVVVVTHDTADGREGMRVPLSALLDDLLLRAVAGEPQPTHSEECLTDALITMSVAVDASSPPAPIEGLPPDVAGPLSPGGERLAFSKVFAGARDLYTITADGTDEFRVTRDGEPDAMPAWSPDGRVLAFARGDPSRSDVYLVGRDGSGLDQLTDLDGWENAPTWSPDGTRVAFIRGATDVNGWGHPGELWVIDSDGTDLSLLRADPTTNPAWSPDGRSIVFDHVGGDGRIGLLELAAGTVTDLGEGFLPQWSPDGTRIVYGVLDSLDGSDIYTMAPDGTQRVRLTDNLTFDTLPQWSPDGTTVLFVSRPVQDAD
jgi:Tol biopolymer transport system component/CubicO group peptidase (beta-lactamase class C family)